MFITTPLVDRFLLALVEPDLNSRLPSSVLHAANHGSICDSSPWRWAYDYFWLCVGAYSSDWSSAATAGTSAPLILTHDPCIWHTKLNGSANGARQSSNSPRELCKFF